ncbi:MAG TPA: bifunctional oligoribonuclease/PAP phosphatase NrnA [Terracidiphilus sp.]|nr:bifunctional oligoribonuclease/PAP phosphatase NrnA [Terracidiphilus sp.]
MSPLPRHTESNGRPGAIGDVDEILRVIGKGERFLVVSHSRPDGDAVGSMLALGEVLRQLGKQADLVTADHVPDVYRRLPGADAIRTAIRVFGPYDAAILLECDGIERARLEGLERFPLINIDHHVTAHAYAQLNWIDCEAVSVGAMVYKLANVAGVKITPAMAACLYTTVLTDTGGFCYGSLRADTFTLARELVEAGADPGNIAREIYFSTPLSKVKVMAAALNTLHCEGGMAWLGITEDDIARAGANDEDTEGIVNVAIGIAGVEAAVFARELRDGAVRISLRSKGKVKVAAIAQRLGGGGHENSAGCTLEGPLDRALGEILGELRAELAPLG